MKSAREPASSRPKPCASLKKSHESCPFARSLSAIVGRKQTVVRDQLSPQKPPVSAFASRAQGFSTPLAHRRSTCPPPAPNLVLCHPIERGTVRLRVLRRCVCCDVRPGFPRQCPLPLACHHLPKGTKSELGKGAPGENHPNQPNRRRVSMDRLNPVDNQLITSFEGESSLVPAIKVLPHSRLDSPVLLTTEFYAGVIGTASTPLEFVSILLLRRQTDTKSGQQGQYPRARV